jgi:hypothetical protein
MTNHSKLKTMNKTMLMLWVLQRTNQLNHEMEVCNDIKDAFVIQGKLDILKEMYDDFCLEEVSKEDITYHNNI